MEGKKKVALNDELLDKVAGGEEYGTPTWCPICGQMVYVGHNCQGKSDSDPYYSKEPIARP